jgi:hypothetical protein
MSATAAYIDALTSADKTRSAHRQAVTEFEEWNAKNKELPNSQRKKFVEDIDKAHLRKFFDYLVDDEPENCSYTAAWKVLRVNRFIRTVLKLDPGKGPIKTSDCKRELKRGEDASEIYARDELKVGVAHGNPIRFQVLAGGFATDAGLLLDAPQRPSQPSQS